MDAEAGDRPVLIFGAAGQLGEAMAVAFRDRWRTIPLTRHDADLARAADVRRIIHGLQPRAIVNCAGYNNVDGAEDAAADALEVNAFAVRTLAHAARDVSAVLVHYSSDFVFDGEIDRPYREDDRPGPQSIYAASKLLGEWFAGDAPTHYVLRVESLFGGLARRNSSLDLIIEKIAAGAPVRVFVDRVVSPSYVWDIVDATTRMLSTRPAPGVYHCVNTGSATWHEVAVEVARQMRVEPCLEPITSGDLRTRVVRPRYCALSNEKLRQAGIVMPSWQDAIARSIDERRVRLS